MNKVIKLIMMLAVLASFQRLAAYDFKLDGIYYNILSEEDQTVEVTNSGYSKCYSGEIILPSRILWNSKTYKVTSIGDGAFCWCSALTSVAIPSSVTSIGNRVFEGCSGLTNVTIPSSVTSIGESAFDGCSALTSVTIPSSVTSIGDYAFFGCSVLTSVAIPSSVTSIGNRVFEGCSGLTNVTIPSSVTSIGDSAFEGCSALTSVTIPSSVTSIGVCAFSACTVLKDINVSQENSTYASIDGILYDKGVQILIQWPGGRNDVILPVSVTSIGEFAFEGCFGLTSVTIPASVTSIGEFAFARCSGLTSVIIPASVTSIGRYAFYRCSALTTIYCRMTEPIECDPYFSDNVLMEATLYIPRGCREVYEKTTPWRNFWNIEEMDYSDVDEIAENGVESICVENGRIVIGGDALTEVFNLQGTCVYHGYGPTVDDLSSGIYIVKNGDRIVKIRL